MLVHARVSFYSYLIDSSRLTFVHAHLEINRVVRNIHLHGVNIEEEIAVIGIQLAHRIIIVGQAVIEGLEIIHITRFDTQRSIQELIRINRVTHPFDGADVVFIPLADGHIDIYTVGVFRVRYYRVCYNIRVSITVFIIFLDYRLFVFLILLGHEFLGAEKVHDIVIVGLFHRLVDLAVSQGVVAGDINLADLGFRLLIDSNQHLYVPGTILIVALDNMHHGVMEPLLRQIFLDHCFGVVLKVRRHLGTLTDTGFHLYILALAFLKSLIPHLADTRTLLQVDDQPYLCSLDLLCPNLYI